jgi:hypothetical protein
MKKKAKKKKKKKKKRTKKVTTERAKTIAERGAVKGDMLPATDAQRTLFKMKTGRELGEGVTRGMAACCIKDAIDNLATGKVKPKRIVSDIEALNQLEADKRSLERELEHTRCKMESYRKDYLRVRQESNEEYMNRPKRDEVIKITAERNLLLDLVERQLPRR